MNIIYIEHKNVRDNKKVEMKRFFYTIGSDIIQVLTRNCGNKSSTNIKCESLIYQIPNISPVMGYQ